MNISTTRFGDIDVSDDLIFNFIKPIVAYENEDQFVLIEHSAGSAFKWLQSTKTPSLAFAVTIPALFGIDYTFELPDIVQEDFGLKSVDDLLAMNIAVIPHGNPRNSTVNLLAPIIFNLENKKAGQIILTGSGFDVCQSLFSAENSENPIKEVEKTEEVQK